MPSNLSCVVTRLVSLAPAALLAPLLDRRSWSVGGLVAVVGGALAALVIAGSGVGVGGEAIKRNGLPSCPAPAMSPRGWGCRGENAGLL